MIILFSWTRKAVNYAEQTDIYSTETLLIWTTSTSSSGKLKTKWHFLRAIGCGVIVKPKWVWFMKSLKPFVILSQHIYLLNIFIYIYPLFLFSTRPKLNHYKFTDNLHTSKWNKMIRVKQMQIIWSNIKFTLTFDGYWWALNFDDAILSEILFLYFLMKFAKEFLFLFWVNCQRNLMIYFKINIDRNIKDYKYQ